MKWILALALTFACVDLFAGTCTSISRTNNAANSVLTSTKYNTDINTVYSAANDLDGGCITDGTLEAAALNTTEFSVPLNGIFDGCKVTRSDAATLSVSACKGSINDGWVNTTTATTVTWGCGSCASEVASSDFYLYMLTTSNGSSLNLLISTTAPTGDGLDGSSNRVLARFRNDASSDINQYSVDQWHVNRFIAQETGWVNGGATALTAVTTDPTKGTMSEDVIRFRRIDDSAHLVLNFSQSAVGAAGSGTYKIQIPNNLRVNTSIMGASQDGSEGSLCSVRMNDSGGAVNQIGTVFTFDDGTDQNISFRSGGTNDALWGSAFKNLGNTTVQMWFNCLIPVVEWSYE